MFGTHLIIHGTKLFVTEIQQSRTSSQDSKGRVKLTLGISLEFLIAIPLLAGLFLFHASSYLTRPKRRA